MLLSSISAYKKYECLYMDSSKDADNACATDGHICEGCSHSMPRLGV